MAQGTACTRRPVGPDLQLTRPGRLETERFELPTSATGHHGGDTGLVAHFADIVARNALAEVLASGRSALEGHLLGFAAERARETGTVVDIDAFRLEHGDTSCRSA